MSKDLNKFSKEMAAVVEAGGKYAVLVNGRRRFPATGVAIGKDLVLTANHVVRSDEEIQVILPDGKSLTAEVKGRDFASDLVLLKLSEEAAVAAETDSEASVGELVFALGRPSSNGIQSSLGIISAVGGPTRVRFGSLEKHYRVDAISYPGFSGGPLINTEGKVVGINTSHLDHGNMISIPMDVALGIAESLEKYGGIRRGFLGISSLPVNIVDVEGVEQESGLLIESVEEGSPADKAGLMVGDIILSFNATEVQEHYELLDAMSGEVVGNPASMDVLRGGKVISLEATVDERKEKREGKRGPRGKMRGKGRGRDRRAWHHHGPKSGHHIGRRAMRRFKRKKHHDDDCC